MNIHEVMEHGPIVAHDEELDFLVTVNGAYFNLWMPGGNVPGYENTDAFDVASRVAEDPSTWRGLYGVDMAKVIDAAEELLNEVLAGDGEE